jgi:hypothetical protein
MKSVLIRHIEAYLLKVNRDFFESKKEDGGEQNFLVNIHEFGKGVFSNKDPQRIKNKYVLTTSHGKG